MTMQVLMLRNRMVDGVLLASGSTQTVSDEDGAYLVANEWATRTDGVPDQRITGDGAASDITDITRDAAGNITGYTEGGVAYVLDYDSDGRVSTITGGGRTETVTYDATGEVAGVTTQ